MNLNTFSTGFFESHVFKAVQMSAIFADSKTFTDCIPLFSEKEIEEKYFQNKNTPDFCLKEFVHDNFKLKIPQSSDYQSDSRESATKHITDLWAILTRDSTHTEGTLIGLPHSCVVPGGRFQEMYYWDSYFTMLGLQVSKRIDLVENMIDNFAHLINQFGFIPNGNRTYFLGRSQPPFFSLMIEILTQEKGEEVLLKYLPVLEKEYEFWMKDKNKLSNQNQASRRVVLVGKNTVLNRYWDEYDTPRPESYREDVELVESITTPSEGIFRHIRAGAESGWDFSSRWFRDGQNMNTIHTTDILPVDLNCLLWNLEKTIFKAYLLTNNVVKIDQYFALYNQREKAIDKYFYLHAKGFYFDYDFIEKKHTDCYSLAAVFPLFFHISDLGKSKNVSDALRKNFLKEGGLITTLNDTGQQWDAPNGWAPLQYMAYLGLQNYGFNDLANEIKTRWLNTNEMVYQQTGKMTEKYNVATTDTAAGGGEYPNQDGFGWTNGVFMKLVISYWGIGYWLLGS
jgi:alpha,alpha-trehalase